MQEENDMVISKTGKYFILFLFVLLPGFLYPQHLSRLKTANQLFESDQYWAALKKYEKVFYKIRSNRKEKNQVAYRMARCYRMTQQYSRTNFLYEHLIRYGYAKKHPIVLLDLADILKMEGDFKNALKYYNMYEDSVPGDPRGKLGIETTRLAKIWMEHPTKYQVKDVREINSRESDFAPAFLSQNYNQLVFTSNRKQSTGKDIDGWTGMKFTDLFQTQLDRNGNWTKPLLLDKTGNIDTKANEGAATLTDHFNTMYFTRCKKIDDKKTGCQIYKSTRTGSNWGKARLVSIHGIDSTEIIGQPTLSPDGLILIFSSNKRGSLGGTDLWISHRDRRGIPFGHPFNMGPVINTKGNEVFPFLRNDSTLYFSSDGHGGMGGLDIFVSKKKNGRWGKPVNLRYPINSTYDDFGIIFQPGENKGYFSSNRKGSKGKEDIYSFVMPTASFTLSGTVQDNQTLFGMPNLKVKLSSAKTQTLSTITNNSGFFSFEKSQISKNTNYTVTVSANNYFTVSKKFSTVGEQFSKDFKINFSMNRIPSRPIVLPDILYAFGKWNLRPQFQDSLQGLVQLLRDNPRLVIELGSHTDSRGSVESNDILSQKRALSVVNYLIMRGINPGRLVAKGYGERVPRTLQKNIEKDGFLFPKGTKLTINYIDHLKSNAKKEAAYALNRRTDFRVLRRDFTPEESASAEADTSMTIPINQPLNAVRFTRNKINGMYMARCIINGYAEQFIFDENNSAQISVKKAVSMLQEGVLTKNDFQNPQTVLRNNTVADHAVVNLKSITIAGKTLKNIQFIVSKNLYFGIVIGKQVLRQFGKYQFNTKTNLLIIHEK